MKNHSVPENEKEKEKKLFNSEQLETLFSVKMENVEAFDFFQDYPGLLMIKLKSGQYIRFNYPGLIEMVLEGFPFKFSGFWSYPLSIVTGKEEDDTSISSYRYLP
jgi:hypothetical protein